MITVSNIAMERRIKKMGKKSANQSVSMHHDGKIRKLFLSKRGVPMVNTKAGSRISLDTTAESILMLKCGILVSQ